MLGLSKLARIVEMFSRRLQVLQSHDQLSNTTPPGARAADEGDCECSVGSNWTCRSWRRCTSKSHVHGQTFLPSLFPFISLSLEVMRGVQKINSKTVTSSMLGNFRQKLPFVFPFLIVLFHMNSSRILFPPLIQYTYSRDDPKTRAEFLTLAKDS